MTLRILCHYTTVQVFTTVFSTLFMVCDRQGTSLDSSAPHNQNPRILGVPCRDGWEPLCTDGLPEYTTSVVRRRTNPPHE
jgi:hypothetical protein